MGMGFISSIGVVLNSILIGVMTRGEELLQPKRRYLITHTSYISSRKEASHSIQLHYHEYDCF